MPPKRPSLRDRATEFAQGDTLAARPDPALHGKERPRQDVIEIPLREIMPNTRQPRTRFDDVALDELAASIREHGVIQPIIVKAVRLTNWDGAVRRYELIAGERRWRASERAGRDMVPAIIRDEASDTALIELALIENLQRADLTPLEEAVAFGQMQSELSYTYDQIGQRIGKSKGYVMNRMRLLRLDDDLRDLVAERPDTLSHIIHLEKLSPEERAPLVTAVRNDSLALVEVRRQVEQRLHPSELLGAPSEPSILFLRKNKIAEPEPTTAQDGDVFLRKNTIAEPEPTTAQDGDVFLCKNEVAEPEPTAAQDGDVFLRKNKIAEPEPTTAQDGDVFLRKNTVSEIAPVTTSDATLFLRKNKSDHGSDISHVMEREIAHIHGVILRWKHMSPIPQDTRQDMLTAINGFLRELEEVIQSLQEPDAGG